MNPKLKESTKKNRVKNASIIKMDTIGTSIMIKMILLILFIMPFRFNEVQNKELILTRY